MKLHIKLLAVGLTLLGAVSFGIISGVNASSQPRDCDSNAIINCGAYSYAELRDKYNKNATGDLDDIYRHYGVDMNALNGAYGGVVTRDGRVVVNGKTVATDAYSVGRQNMPGSHAVKINGRTYYQRSDTRNFLSDIQAYVFFKNGQFAYAILKSCGNPLIATPVKPPTPPKPQPKNIQVCDLRSWKVVTIREDQFDGNKYSKNLGDCKPVVVCNNLTFTQTSRTAFSFRTSASASRGGVISGYTYNFGDGTTARGGATINHTYARPGTYTVTVTVNSNAGNKNCQVRVTVAPEPVAACTGLTAAISNRTKVSLRGSASAANGAKISAYVFTVTDTSNKTVFTKTVATSATSATADTNLETGEYKAKVVVKTSLGDKAGANCEKAFTIVKPKTPGVDITKLVDGVKYQRVKTNVEFTYQLKVTNTGETDLKNVVVTDTPPKGVTLIKGNKGTVTANKWTYTIPELKLGTSMEFAITAQVPAAIGGMLVNTACVDAPEIPGNPNDCDTAKVDVSCPVPGKEDLPVDSPECKEVPVPPVTPETPELPKLPETGPAEALLSLLGIGSLVGASVAYIASRKQ